MARPKIFVPLAALCIAASQGRSRLLEEEGVVGVVGLPRLLQNASNESATTSTTFSPILEAEGGTTLAGTLLAITTIAGEAVDPPDVETSAPPHVGTTNAPEDEAMAHVNSTANVNTTAFLNTTANPESSPVHTTADLPTLTVFPAEPSEDSDENTTVTTTTLTRRPSIGGVPGGDGGGPGGGGMTFPPLPGLDVPRDYGSTLPPPEPSDEDDVRDAAPCIGFSGLALALLAALWGS